MEAQQDMAEPGSGSVLLRRWPLYALFGAVWLLMLLAGLGELDRSIVVAVHVGQSPWLDLALFVSSLGDWEVLLALPLFAGAWLLLHGRRWRLAALLLGSSVAGRLLVDLQKLLLTRLRPDEFEHPVAVYSFAFPSGHAANSMIVYLLLALLLIRDEGRKRAAATAAVLLSVVIGISRVLLGVHWPSDVIGGWAFGLLWVLATMAFAPRVEARDREAGGKNGRSGQ